MFEERGIDDISREFGSGYPGGMHHFFLKYDIVHRVKVIFVH